MQRDLSAGVAFSGRSYRLNGSQTRTAEQAETNTPAQQPNQADGVALISEAEDTDSMGVRQNLLLS